MNKIIGILSLFTAFIPLGASNPNGAPPPPPVLPAPVHSSASPLALAAPAFLASLFAGVTYRACKDYYSYSKMKKEIAQAVTQLEEDLEEYQKNPAHLPAVEKASAQLKRILDQHNSNRSL